MFQARDAGYAAGGIWGPGLPRNGNFNRVCCMVCPDALWSKLCGTPGQKRHPRKLHPRSRRQELFFFFSDDFSSPYNAILEMLDTRRRQLPRPWHLSRRLRFCRSNFEDVYKNIWIYTIYILYEYFIWIFYMNILYENVYIYIMYWMVWKINLCHNAIVHKRAQAKPKEAAKASGHAL